MHLGHLGRDGPARAGRSSARRSRARRGRYLLPGRAGGAAAAEVVEHRHGARRQPGVAHHLGQPLVAHHFGSGMSLTSRETPNTVKRPSPSGSPVMVVAQARGVAVRPGRVMVEGLDRLAPARGGQGGAEGLELGAISHGGQGRRSAPGSRWARPAGCWPRPTARRGGGRLRSATPRPRRRPNMMRRTAVSSPRPAGWAASARLRPRPGDAFPCVDLTVPATTPAPVVPRQRLSRRWVNNG